MACSTSSTVLASRPASPGLVQPRIAKIAFTGETTTGRLIMQVRQPEPDSGDARARRQVANIFCRRLAEDDDFFGQGSRASPCSRSTRAKSAPAPAALVQESICSRPVHGARLKRTEAIKQGNPRQGDHDRRAGLERAARKILSYIDIGGRKAREVLTAAEGA